MPQLLLQLPRIERRERSADGDGVDRSGVFDRFRQADPSPTRGAWGLGIGLSIARHLVELHGGTIEAASDGLGHGATFVVQLPMEAARAAVDERRAQPTEAVRARY